MSDAEFQTQDEGSYREFDDGSTVWSQFRSYEWWETFGPDGRTYSRGPTRDEAIDRHIMGNEKLKRAEEQVNELKRRQGEAEDYDVELVPIAGVRHVIRWQSDSGFQRTDKEETFQLGG